MERSQVIYIWNTPNILNSIISLYSDLVTIIIIILFKLKNKFIYLNDINKEKQLK